VLFGGAATAALVDLFYGPKEMCKVIGYDSFSELPGFSPRDELDGEECDAQDKEVGKKKKLKNGTLSKA
jgi:hypothetical protein